jgi:hypothetical protein
MGSHTALQQSVSKLHVDSVGKQVVEQVKAFWSHIPLQQAPSEVHVTPTPEQAPEPPAPEPPIPPKPHELLVQVSSQQSLSTSHGVLSAAQAITLPGATQMSSWHVASATHVPPPLQSPSISIMPAAGGTQTPLVQEKLAHSTSLLHGEVSASTGATVPMPPTMRLQYTENSERTAQRSANGRRFMPGCSPFPERIPRASVRPYAGLPYSLTAPILRASLGGRWTSGARPCVSRPSRPR